VGVSSVSERVLTGVLEEEDILMCFCSVLVWFAEDEGFEVE
jgi:hypothetical protein